MTKASWLRSEIEKLEKAKVKSSCGCPPFQPQHDGYCWNEEFPGESKAYNEALTSIITRYKEELKELESKKTCEICHGFGNNGADDAPCLNCGGSGEELLELDGKEV